MNDYQSIWDAHWGSIRVVKYCNESTSGETRPVHCAPYWVSPRACEFEKLQIDSMLEMRVFEPAEKNCAVILVFSRKKNGPQHLFVNHRKVRNLSVCNCYPILRMDECVALLGNALVFPTLDANRSLCTLKWMMHITSGPDKLCFASSNIQGNKNANLILQRT